MQILWLVLGSLILPPVWGWIANRLMARLWPEEQPAAAFESGRHRPASLDDYQI